MSASAEETDWNKLTVVQLKGALARRALNMHGTKEELVQRLQEYDQPQDKGAADNILTEMDIEESPETLVTKFSPRLTKEDFKEPIGLILSMRTVIVNNFKPTLMQNPSFVSWLDESVSYIIRKNKIGDSAAELIFSSVEKGDAALADLKSSLKQEGIDVFHPKRNMSVKLNRNEINYPDDYTILMKKKLRPQGGIFWDRLIALENVPAELNTEEKLHEYFPEAADCYSFEFDSNAKGIAVLDFNAPKLSQEYLLKVGNEIKLLDEPVKVALYSERQKEWNRMRSAKILHDIVNRNPPTTDEDRVALNTKLTQLRNEYKEEEESDDCFGHDKLAKLLDLRLKIKPALAMLSKNTQLRLSQGEFTMPEPEEEMHVETIKFIADKKRNIAKREEREKQNSEATPLKTFGNKKKYQPKKKQSLQSAQADGNSDVNPNQQLEDPSSAQGQWQDGTTGQGSWKKNRNRKKNKNKAKQGRQPTTGDGEPNQNQQGEWQSPQAQGNKKKNAQKRPGSMHNPGQSILGQPPQKKQQMNEKKQQKRGKRGGKMNRGRTDSYNEGYVYDEDYGQGDSYRPDYGYRQDNRHNFKPEAYSVNPNKQSSDDALQVIKGITSALTDKMLQLEEMQKQTLQTQQNLLTQQNLQEPVAPLNTGFSNTGPGFSGTGSGFNTAGTGYSTYGPGIGQGFQAYGTTGFGSMYPGQNNASSFGSASSSALPTGATNFGQATSLDSASSVPSFGQANMSSGYGPTNHSGGFDYSGSPGGYSQQQITASSTVPPPNPSAFITGQTSYSNMGRNNPKSNTNKAYGFKKSARRY